MRYLSVLSLLLTTFAATGCADSPPPTPRNTHSHTHDTSHTHHSDLPDTQPRDTSTAPDTTDTSSLDSSPSQPSPSDTSDTTNPDVIPDTSDDADGGPDTIPINNVMWQFDGSYLQTTGPLSASINTRLDELTITDGSSIHIRISNLAARLDANLSTVSCDDPSFGPQTRISLLTHDQTSLPFTWQNLELSPPFPDCTLDNYPDNIHTWDIQFDTFSPNRIVGLLRLAILGKGPRQDDILYIVSRFDLRPTP